MQRITTDTRTSIGRRNIHPLRKSPTKGIQEEQHFVFTREQEQCSECNYTNVLENYLYEPNASLLKAGAFRSIASAFPVKNCILTVIFILLMCWSRAFPAGLSTSLVSAALIKKN